MSVVSLFTAVAARNAKLVAINTSGIDITYFDLEALSNRWANYIDDLCSVSDLGEHSGVAAIYLDRCPEQVVGALSVLKQGWAYVPLDPSQPDGRIRSILQDCAAVVIITSIELRPKLEALIRGLEDIPIVIEIDDDLIIENVSDKPLSREISEYDSAYIIYTSGSTGMPKGVELAHAGLINLINYEIKEFLLGPGKVVLGFSNFIFDAAVWETFSAICSGASLCIVDRQAVIPGKDLIDTINRHFITHLTLPPSVLSAMPYHKFPSLEVLVSAGEACTRHIVEKWGNDQWRFYNAYGPTEATVCVTLMVVSVEDEIIHLGKPIDNMNLFLLNKDMQLVLPGDVGEIYLSGIGLAKQYVNNRKATNEAFLMIQDPSGSRETIRCYKTGDLGVIDAGGRIEFRGRSDSQIKHSGYRIDMGEIESVLHELEYVLNCAVCYQQVNGSYEIVAYCCLDDCAKDEYKRLMIAHLKKHLAEYMIPKRWVILGELPLTANGKIDRKKLFVPCDDVLNDAGVQVGDEVENAITSIFKEVLNVSSLEGQDDFFELGGHSLLVVQVVMLIEERCGVCINMADFFAAPTVYNLCSLVRSAERVEKIEPSSTPLRRGNNLYEPFPLTQIQQAYYLGRSGYFELSDVSTNVYREFYLDNIDPDRLTCALNVLIDRHEMLRCRFINASEQQISEHIDPISISVTDISGRDLVEKNNYFDSIRKEMSISKLDALTPPLLEARLTRYADGWCLHVVIDALIMDGWSYYKFFNEWGTLYYNPENILPELDVSYQDYILALEMEKRGKSYLEAESYWLNRVELLPFGPNLPLMKQPKEVSNQAVKSLRCIVDERNWRAVKSFITENGWRDTTMLMALFAHVLGVWSASDHFTLCLTLFNRHPIGRDINNLIGVFTTLILLEVRLSSISFADTLKSIQEQLFVDLDHRQYSGVSVQKAHRQHHKYAAEGTMTPVVFTSFLSAQEISDRDSIFSESNCRYTSTQTSQVWLDAKVYESYGRLIIEWDYIEDLFPEGMVQDMFASYSNKINEIVGDTSKIYEPFSVSYAAKKDIKVTKSLAVDKASTLISSFNKSASANPNSEAVISHDGSLSYGGLSDRANTLATILHHDFGFVKKVVAVILPPSLYQSISIVGVMKSGCAYLPIDPLQPDNRLSYMLTNAGVSAVIAFKDQVSRLQSLSWYTIAESPIILPVGIGGIDLEKKVEPVNVKVSRDDLAYVIYTSGSTGLPKGVMITHGAALNTIEDINSVFGISGKSVILSVSNFSFDLSVYDYFGMFDAGGCVVTIRPGSEKDPAYWLDLIASHNINIWNSVPMLAKMLVAYYKTQPDVYSLNTMDLYLLSGDWVQKSLVEEIKSCYWDVCQPSIISLGGATECSIWSIYHKVVPSDRYKKAIPYGRSMSNQQVVVLDDNHELCPNYVCGDIYISGEGLAKGYINDYDRTKQQFIYSKITREKIYKTGDLGYFLPDGEIVFIGRNDGQVKVGGHRIELGEINYHLEQLPGVSVSYSCVVDVDESKFLYAFYVPDGGVNSSHLDESMFRTKINSVLPAYMQPYAYKCLKNIPLNDNGKVDFSKLKDIAVEECRRGSMRGTNKRIDSRLLKIWGNILNTNHLSEITDFFSSGGDSLKLIELMSLINKEFSVSISIPELINNRTLGEQTVLLDYKMSREVCE